MSRSTSARRPITANSDGTFTITLTKGQVAVIDACDLCTAEQHSWYASYSKSSNRYYAYTALYDDTGKRTVTSLHRIILGVTSSSLHVDHRDHDTLNNRRYNLRIATRVQNNRNLRRRTDGASQFKGVAWNKRLGKWQAYIDADGRKHLGYFTSELEAAHAYDTAAVLLHGEYDTPHHRLRARDA